jgi:TonB family protein
MEISSFFSRLSHFAIAPIAIVTLIVLACSTPAFCSEIYEAATTGDLAKAKALLKDNPELVYSRNINRRTPLHYAAQNGHKDVAELLLANKAEVNAKDSSGYMPMHMAARYDHKDVVELLLANKADVNTQGAAGDTPLHLAAAEGHKDVVEFLLARKAEVNAKTIMGVTPLDRADWNGRKDVVELLRKSGGINGVAGIYAPTISGVKEPVPVTTPMPPYTEESRRVRIDGTIVLQAIIRKNGTVTDVKVIKGLGYGLDESVINTIVTKWRFRPGTLNGEPIDVIANEEVRFRTD